MVDQDATAIVANPPAQAGPYDLSAIDIRIGLSADGNRLHKGMHIADGVGLKQSLALEFAFMQLELQPPGHIDDRRMDGARRSSYLFGKRIPDW